MAKIVTMKETTELALEYEHDETAPTARFRLDYEQRYQFEGTPLRFGITVNEGGSIDNSAVRTDSGEDLDYKLTQLVRERFELARRHYRNHPL